MQTLGSSEAKYSIKKYLGNVRVDDLTTQPQISKGVPERRPVFSISLGVQDITSIREILELDKEFVVDPYIKVNLKNNFEYYRVSVVADFFHQQKDIKFTHGMVTVSLVSNSNTSKPQIYSVSPQRIDEQEQVEKEFGINPSLKLADVDVSGVSLSYKKQYVKLHPQILGHFSGGQTVSWEFMTTNNIDDVNGAQLIEFMVKQPSNTRSRWEATPEADVNWASKLMKVKAALAGNSLPTMGDKFEQFSIPSY